MERSESIKELSKALVEFHKKVGKVIKDAKGYNYRYATLSNILDVIQDPLNECGLSIIQLPQGDHELVTILAHISGEFISNTSRMTPKQDDPQGRGSCITYQRRYSIGAVLCINIDDDDDGAAACGIKQPQQQPQQQPRQQPPKPKTRKILIVEALNDEFMAWVYKQEAETRAAGKPFSLKSLLDNHYRVDDNVFNKASEIYVNYKTNNNLK